LIGDIVDSLIRNQGLQDVMYQCNSAAYPWVLSVSLFLEIVLVSGIIYLFFNMISPPSTGPEKL